MDEKLTMQMQQWLDTAKEKRDIKAGAMMVLQCSRNRVFYDNVMRNPDKYADAVEYQLRKWYNFRIQKKTHAEVEAMARQAAVIASTLKLNEPEKEDQTAQTETKNADGHQTGKRPDHDNLPDEIKALYVENLDIMRKMREVHMQLRALNTMKDGSVCPDSDRYPFLKELIELDKRYRSNWKEYDNANAGSKSAAAKTSKKTSGKSTKKTTGKKATK